MCIWKTCNIVAQIGILNAFSPGGNTILHPIHCCSFFFTLQDAGQLIMNGHSSCASVRDWRVERRTHRGRSNTVLPQPVSPLSPAVSESQTCIAFKEIRDPAGQFFSTPQKINVRPVYLHTSVSCWPSPETQPFLFCFVLARPVPPRDLRAGGPQKNNGPLRITLLYLWASQKKGHQTGASAWRSSAPGPMLSHPPPPVSAPCSRLTQSLPHVAEKNSVLVLQTKDLN